MKTVNNTIYRPTKVTKGGIRAVSSNKPVRIAQNHWTGLDGWPKTARPKAGGQTRARVAQG
jgi:hypothetical protein